MEGADTIRERGMLISVDGMDGSGKSTLVKNLALDLGRNFVYYDTFEKRKTISEVISISQKYKELYHNMFSEELINKLWLIDLCEVAFDDIENILNRGKNVILDRYILSAKVYSLATTNSDISHLFRIYDMLPMPHFGVYIDVNPSIAERRILLRDDKVARYENYSGLVRIQKVYERMMEKEPYPILRVNGNRSQEEVLARVSSWIRNLVLEFPQSASKNKK